MTLINKIIVPLSRFSALFKQKNIYQKEYDQYAHCYDQVVTRALLSRYTEQILNDLALAPGMRCLDLGCGTGHATRIISEKILPDGKIVGCDISQSMLDIAREQSPSHGSIAYERFDMLKYIQAQKEGSFDLITAFWSLGYTPCLKTLREMRRALKAAGHVAILINTQQSLSDLQNLVLNLFFKKPTIFKCLPPIYFPADEQEFRRIIQRSGLGIVRLSSQSCEQNFSTGSDLVEWMKTSGPCAGFREAINLRYKDWIYSSIQKTVDQQKGFTITFHFNQFIGTKNAT